MHRGRRLLGLCRGLRCTRRIGAQGGGDVAEGLDLGHFFSGDGAPAGQALFQGGQDFHPLDGIDAQVGLQVHAGVEHGFRVAGELGYHGHQDGEHAVVGTLR